MFDPIGLASLAVDATFAEFGFVATYRPSRGADVTCAVLFEAPDVSVAGPINTRAIAGTRTIEVRVSEIAAPARGERFFVDGAKYMIISDPKADDAHRLVWKMTVSPR